MRLIDAEKAKEALTGWDTDPTDEEIEYTIDHLPTIEAAPVVHGRWIPCENGGYYCSRCDTRVAFIIHNKFCPNCGAKMKGE